MSSFHGCIFSRHLQLVYGTEASNSVSCVTGQESPSVMVQLKRTVQRLLSYGWSEESVVFFASWDL